MFTWEKGIAFSPKAIDSRMKITHLIIRCSISIPSEILGGQSVKLVLMALGFPRVLVPSGPRVAPRAEFYHFWSLSSWALQFVFFVFSFFLVGEKRTERVWLGRHAPGWLTMVPSGRHWTTRCYYRTWHLLGRGAITLLARSRCLRFYFVVESQAHLFDRESVSQRF